MRVDMVDIGGGLKMAFFQAFTAERLFAQNHGASAPDGISPAIQVIPLAHVAVRTAQFDAAAMCEAVPIRHALVTARFTAKR